LKARAGELTVGQLVALRFASDEELAELVRRVLDERITDQKEIKRAVRSWRPDHQRM
jgi:tRNA(Ser,Leu) C12 N-acetylase TAN1